MYVCLYMCIASVYFYIHLVDSQHLKLISYGYFTILM